MAGWGAVNMHRHCKVRGAAQGLRGQSSKKKALVDIMFAPTVLCHLGASHVVRVGVGGCCGVLDAIGAGWGGWGTSTLVASN